ncbi:hypothetical protein Hypma_002274 [Hypsizygus marmoreus]|uniref:F-box domain-containing protein n=1 Tax=Hypsizygus marmoreus TaxID=39966 RepID=A0A369K1Q9_HYPMA|nr:hypothetical protein Hypma_002274 [Hypsizygus marmoreus]
MVLSRPIPPDIIREIVNELPFNRTFLLQSSTISRAFAFVCQCRLFETVGIGSSKGRERCQQLHRLLTDSPHLARLIHNLTLQNRAIKISTLYGGQERAEWFLVEATLPLLLDMLPALKSVQLKSSTIATYWSDLPHELQTSLLRVFSLPSLTAIGFSDIIAPANVLSHSANLAKLDLHHSKIVDGMEGWSSSSLIGDEAVKPPLQILSARYGMPSLRVLKSALDITRLREFILADEPNCDQHMAELLRCSRESLERFTWVQPHICVHTCDPNSALTSHLRFLEVIFQGFLVDEPSSPLTWTLHALRALSTCRTGSVDLEELTIRTTVSWVRAMLTYQSTSWATFDAILGEQDVFVKLRHVRIVLYGLHDYRNDFDISKTYIEGDMSRIGDLGILSIENAHRPFAEHHNSD